MGNPAFLDFLRREYNERRFLKVEATQFKYIYFNPSRTGYKVSDMPDDFGGIEIFLTDMILPGTIFFTEKEAFENASKASKTLIRTARSLGQFNL